MFRKIYRVLTVVAIVAAATGLLASGADARKIVWLRSSASRKASGRSMAIKARTSVFDVKAQI